MNWEHLDCLAKDLSSLRRAGYNIPSDPIYRMVPGNENMSLYIIYPEGNLFELVARPPGSSWQTNT